MEKSSGAVLQVDWRADRLKTQQQILRRITDILIDFDQHGWCDLETSDSRAKGSLQLLRTNEHGQPDPKADRVMWVRFKNPYRRYFDTDHQKIWMSRLFRVVLNMIERVGYERPVMQRTIQYELASGSMTAEESRNMANHVAITCGLHPSTLGIIPDSDALVTIPTDCELLVSEVVDLFRWRNHGEKHIITNLKGFNRSIPRHVLQIRLKHSPSNKALRAVVVVEHRNLKAALDKAVPGSADLQGMIVIMTSGNPDRAVREFLWQLGNTPKIKDLPFLYISDHDFSGFGNFLTLKYGSKAMAWISATTTCPNLQWAGPTVDDVLKVIKEVTIGEVRSTYSTTRSRHDSIQGQIKESVQEKETQFINAMERDSRAAGTVQDFNSLTGWEASNILQYEPHLAKEIDYMKAKRGYFFSLLALSNWSNQSVEYFFARAICRARNERLPRPILPGLQAPTAPYFDKHPSSSIVPQKRKLLGDHDDAKEKEELLRSRVAFRRGIGTPLEGTPHQ